MVRNMYIYPPRQSLCKVTANVMGYASFNITLFNSVSVLGYHMQEAGFATALELVFNIADGMEYIRTSIEVANLKVEVVAPILLFFWGIMMNFNTNIANTRAVRRVWAKLTKEQYQPQNSKLLLLRAQCQNSGYSLTEYQLSNNVVRIIVEAMLAVMGGHNSSIRTRKTRR